MSRPYKRLAPGVLAELRRVVPRNDAGKPKAKFHQMLTEDLGHPRLREHLAAIIALMKASADWTMLMSMADRALPRYGDTLLLPEAEPQDDPTEA